MSEKAANSDDYAKFNGMQSSVDPHDVTVGQSVLQINGTCIRPGELLIRKGLKEVAFEEES